MTKVRMTPNVGEDAEEPRMLLTCPPLSPNSLALQYSADAVNLHPLKMAKECV